MLRSTNKTITQLAISLMKDRHFEEAVMKIALFVVAVIVMYSVVAWVVSDTVVKAGIF
jgi:hypothetical protein